jgi:hypothetical protein
MMEAAGVKPARLLKTLKLLIPEKARKTRKARQFERKWRMSSLTSVSEPGSSLEEIARSALTGDPGALERMIGALQGDLFGLALRM